MRRVALFVAALWLCTIGPVFAGALTVTVAAETIVPGPSISFGDIADISGDDLQRIRYLQSLRIGGAAPPGGRLQFTRELLGSKLAAVGADFSGIIWNVPDQVSIVTDSQQVAGQKIIDAGMNFLQSRLGSSNADLEIEAFGYQEDLAVPVGDLSLQCELPYGVRKGGPTLVNVTVQANGRIFTKIGVRYTVRIFDTVLVASRAIGADEPLNTGNVVLQRMDTAPLGNGYLTGYRQIDGMIARRPIAPGAVLTEISLEKPVMIKRGTNITILARKGDLEVGAPGLAMQDGTLGQIIRVQNLTSKRYLTAKVISSDAVLVTSMR